MVKKRIGGKHGFEKFEEKKTKYKADAAVDVALLDIGFGMLEQQDRTQTQQDEFKSQHVKSLRDYNKPWEERTAIVAEWQNKGWGDTIPLDCPATFGPFQVSSWGGFGGCGFDIWFNDENGKKQKRWIDLDPTYNLVKDPIVNSIPEQERTPECLFKIFPGGYYVTESSTELVAPPVVQGEVTTEVQKLEVETNPVKNIEVEPAPGAAAAAGGAYRKTRRNRKTKRTNKRKSKRANKKTNKRRCKKTKKHKK